MFTQDGSEGTKIREENERMTTRQLKIRSLNHRVVCILHNDNGEGKDIIRVTSFTEEYKYNCSSSRELSPSGTLQIQNQNVIIATEQHLGYPETERYSSRGRKGKEYDVGIIY